ncbi:prolyl oligopeptidase family serine peptidase [Arthrobacter sp. JZ12]|uniref:alpha/beta hydrolase n=1 Tax=Arthrobacter sp. JZ12 TaxID=2654190 RepID=UPI002B4A5A1E|nr:alpha/beta hydrolase [Arthrobacter sp. JZ12]WRH24557.1 prolyl oligopeptidase family serine peptidase [Arthrobacter sp. JZ12]
MAQERASGADEDPSSALPHEPTVTIRPASAPTRGVALVLHGGRANSFERVRSRHLSPARMLPFARLLSSWGGPAGLETWTLRNRVRGWNGALMSPLQDARWALERISEQHPGMPVYLLGHSMGGRTALGAAGAPQVRAVVALAPWLDSSSSSQPLAGRRVLILHGEADRWTSPAASLRFAQRLQDTADDVRYVRLSGAGHFMFTKLPVWHELSVSYLLDCFARDTGAPVQDKYRRRAAALLAQPPLSVVL